MVTNDTGGIALKLDEVHPRKTVEIYGEIYPLASPDDWGLKQKQEFSRIIELIRLIQQKPTDKILDSDETEYVDLSVKICCMMLPECPKEVIKGLKPSQREAIIMTFFAILGEENPLLRQQETLTSLQRLQNYNASMEQVTPESG